MYRRFAAAGVVALGIALIAIVTTTQLFARSNAWERLTAKTRVQFTDASIAQQKTDLAGLVAIDRGLSTALPALGAQTGLSSAQLQAFLGQFPDFATGTTALPQIEGRLQALITLNEQQRAHFVSADAIPTAARSSTAVPWFILITGILAIGFGLLMLRPSMSWSVLAAVLGIVIVATPLVTQLPQKGRDSDRLNAAVASVYTDARITGLQQDASTLGAMATSLQTQVLPAVATKLGTTPQALQTNIQQFFPQLGTALAAAPGALTRMTQTASLLSATRSDFAETAGTRYMPIAWSVIACGLAIFLLATWTGAGAASAVRHEEAERRARKAA